MDREEMIQTIVDDLEAWLERDAYSFWDHVRDMERAYLRNKDDKELESIYQEAI